MITQNQLPERFLEVINEQAEIFDQGQSIQNVNTIPDTTAIPIENPNHWLKIEDVICVYVDMLGSTKFSAISHPKTTAGAYQLFTGTAVKLFSKFEAPYIDVRGDGAFALFDKNQSYRALSAAVTFKTFVKEVFKSKIRKELETEVGSHIGIDQKTVLVRKIGFKRYRGRTDRQNEVWAGRPINMAAKLASMSKDDELLVSDRFFGNISHELAIQSCGCPDGYKVDLWSAVDLSFDSKFDFNTAYKLETQWCKDHGKDFCEAILSLDEQ